MATLNVKEATVGIKFDNEKAPISLINRRALEAEAQVMAYGAKKYARHNWRKGFESSRLLDAALRHIIAYADGEDTDPETGLSHLAHARCCLAFQIELEVTRPDLDDRHVREAGEQIQNSPASTPTGRSSPRKNEQPVQQRDTRRLVQRK
jgi:hypothetical protein